MYSESDPDLIRFQSNDRRNYSVSNNEYPDTDITNRNNSNNEKKELLCMYACEVRLPAGRYLSEMDGSIFVINASQPKVTDDITSELVENEVERSANAAPPLATLSSSKRTIFAAFINDCNNQKRNDTGIQMNGFDPRSLLIDAFPSADIFKDFSPPNSCKGVLR